MARFTASARTVDMLGRQQIAGIPNAISELFKNAYDAYADRVVVDYYVPERLLVLRDNGLGMTRDDIDHRWLVLGTESKVAGRSGGLAEVAKRLGLGNRNTVGEKGIGRLAIGVIGPQVLVLSRARRVEESHSTVSAFVNWSLFELPGVSLDEIEVPVMEFGDGVLPDGSAVVEMVEEARQSLIRLEGRVDHERAAEISRQFDGFKFDPAGLQARFGTSGLSHDSYGTQFYIYPVDPLLDEALEEGRQPPARRASRWKLRNMLVGFTNTMLDESAEPPIETDFFAYPTMDVREQIIGREEFFTPEEFESADHHMSGRFDERGQFVGMVSVYGGEPHRHVIAWTDGRGRETDCGPFNLHLAYVQGQEHESRMHLEDWQKLNRKLDAMGGLYIYRNGIRILPYGDPEFDFLRFEERRTRSAGRYFFSYRRMFGTIELSDERKYKLGEKAGREGFMENRAYRQFRDILEHFFTQMAADFFRDDALVGDFRTERQGLSRQAMTARSREQESRSRRLQFERNLNHRMADLSSGSLDKRVGEIVDKFNADLLEASGLLSSEDRVDAFLNAGLEAGRQMEEVRVDYRTPELEGFGATQALRRELDAYEEEFARREDTVIKPATLLIEETLLKTSKRLGVVSGQRQQFESGIKSVADSEISSVESDGRDAVAEALRVAKRIDESVSALLQDFHDVIVEIDGRIKNFELDALSDGAAAEIAVTLKSDIVRAAREKKRLIGDIRRQFTAISFVPDEGGSIVTPDDVVSAVEEDMNALREAADRDLEHVQLGMAVEIIDHEFQTAIRSLRHYLRRLRSWAVRNEDLSEVYEGIRVNFDHLDGYLRLFTPLRRRLQRNAIEIKGSNIGNFIKDLFDARLERHNVELVQTSAFRGHSFIGYPSTFYPVFINLVDNALSWLQNRDSGRLLRFDIEGEAMLVYDNGPGIPVRDREVVFDAGFTRKPGGRGLGLYIARNELRRAGYSLTISESPNGEGTMFRVEPEERGND